VTRLRWSPRSVDDLEAIRGFIARDSSQYADLVIQRIVAAADRLTQFPEIGRIVPEVGEPRLRELIVRPFRVVYRIRPDLVEVVTVFRSSRQLPQIVE
jgi:plasmid stabilization system protein ParE